MKFMLFILTLVLILLQGCSTKEASPSSNLEQNISIIESENTVKDCVKCQEDTSEFEEEFYGGTFSGPIIKDKLWFFASYEKFEASDTAAIQYGTEGSGREREIEGVSDADVDLIRRAQGGDRAAFGSLVERYMKRAYYSALGLVGSPEDARDLSQDACARAFRARQTIDPDRTFFAWLYQIVRNQARDLIRRERVRGHESLDAWLEEGRPEAADPSADPSCDRLDRPVRSVDRGRPA